MDRIETALNGLGFSSYEAKAYTALVREYPLTGYEVAKRSGIPRSKVYESIERLVRKRLVTAVEDNPVKYVAVPPEELVRRLSSEFESSVTNLDRLLKEEHGNDAFEYIFNISGYGNILDKATDMISHAERTVDISIWREEWPEVRKSCVRSAEKGVGIRVLGFNGIAKVSGVKLFHHRPFRSGEPADRWITVVTDKNEILTGQCSGDSIIAAWTKNRCLVFMGLKYIEHEIIKISGA